MAKLITIHATITGRHRLNVLAIAGPEGPGIQAGHIHRRVLRPGASMNGSSQCSSSPVQFNLAVAMVSLSNADHTINQSKASWDS